MRFVVTACSIQLILIASCERKSFTNLSKGSQRNGGFHTLNQSILSGESWEAVRVPPFFRKEYSDSGTLIRGNIR